MATFIHMDYDLFWDFFEIADLKGLRISMGNPSHTQRRNAFIQAHNIDLKIAAKAMDKLGINHMKMTIIESGSGEGFYIYSLEKEICYKYRKTDKLLFEKTSWGSTNW
jgi:hypothetical protein